MMPSDCRFLLILTAVFRHASAGGALAVFASAVSLAHADVVITFAESPVSVIRGAYLYRTGAGTRLHDDDVVETDAGQSAQLEDAAGTLIALGPKTQILLGTPLAPQPALKELARISMLNGWLKVSCTVSVAQHPPLSIELRRLIVEPAGDGAWSVVAMATTQHVGIFAETGNDTVVAQAPAQQSKQTLRAGQYLERSADEPLLAQSHPSVEFIGFIPPAFRDNLVGLSGRLENWHELPAPVRAVDYADVSDWLTSNVSGRGTFVKRFAPRLGSASFRSAVDAHLDVLPEWRPVLHPPPRASTVPRKRHSQALPATGVERGVDADDQDRTTSDGIDAH